MPDIGTGTAVYAANETKGTEVSSTYEGRHLTFRANELATVTGGGVVVKGEPVVVKASGGDIVGVAFNGGSGTDLIAIDTEGIFNLLVQGQDDFGPMAVTVGDALFIDTDDIGCTISRRHDPEQHTLFGYALGGVTANQEAIIAVKVHWGPSVDNIWMGIGTNYTTDRTAVPRVKIESDTELTTAGHIHIGFEMNVTATAVSTDSSFYGIRSRAIISAATTVGGSAHPTGVHGYAVILGTVSGADVTVAGVKGEIHSSGASVNLTTARFLAGVHAICALQDEVTTGVYSAYIAYSWNGTALERPDCMFYAWGYYDDGIDLTGWANAGGSALRLTAGRGTNAAGHGVGAAGNLLIDVGGVEHYIHIYSN